jgi:asparagine synthase (glutamine-hydrolysing)
MRHGIAGILRLDGTAADTGDAALVDAMAAAIVHRGLAERTVHRDGPLALAAPAGAAARSPDGALLALVDGFVVSAPEHATPAEAVLALYARHGDDFARHLVGSFAIALFDGRARRLVLARDRAGVRPLFVARPSTGLLLFGSELKALLAHPAAPREVDWMGTLARAALPMRSTPPFSPFRGIDPVAPGRYLVADARAMSVADHRYWRLEFSQESAQRHTEEDLIAGYREVLATAVRDATSDGVPPALLLSGGIDSIAIAALGRERRPETFTVFAQSTLGNGDAPIARAAAEHLGLPNHQVVFGRGVDALTPDRWRQIVWMCESPLCRGQHYLKSELARHARAARPDLGILLHGEGSDELIGADPRNWSDHREDATYDEYIAALRMMQREELLSFEALAAESLFGGKRRIFNDDFLAAAVGKEVPRHPMQRRAVYCLEGLADEVLWREDRQGAWYGLEARAPFVDHRLLEFVAAIPPGLHPSLFWRKRILRDALRPDLPDALRLQRKIPFYAGTDARFTNRALLDVLRADGAALVHEAFGDPDRHPVLAPGFVEGFLEETIRDPSGDGVDALFRFVNLGLLEAMARDVAAQARLRAVRAPLLVELGRWDETRIAELLADPARAVGPERVLSLGPGVELARPERLDSEDVLWVVVDDVVRYVVGGDDSRAWREVLRRVDGVRPLGTLLAEVGAPLENIRKHLEEALEFGVVT